MILSDQQVQFFETFGFLVRRNVFSAAEVVRYTAEVDLRAAASHRLIPFVPAAIGQGGRQQNLLVPSTPFLTSLMEDDRLAGAAEELVGELAWIGANAHQFVGNSVWHFDGGCRQWNGVNNLIYTRPVRGDSGALRVLPGSHHWEVHEAAASYDPLGTRWTRAAATPEEKRRALAAVDAIPGFVCDANPGDVVSFHMQVYHGSSGGGGDRRACTLSYHGMPQTPEQTEMAIHMAEGALRDGDNSHAPWNPVREFPDEWIANPEDNPRRAAWVANLRKYSAMEKEKHGVRAEVENGKLAMVPT